ncbi:MAG: chorismate mutase [Rhodospirillaceae bacterium]|nr:chorismate mutase [Rhodospirillaceae bacterium]
MRGVKRPEQCKNLLDVRAAIDAYDDILLPLLAQRLKLVMSAARFKPSVKGVVKKDRVEEIIVRVRQAAEAFGVSPDCFEYTYRHLITAYTREEQRNWPKIHRR